MMKTLLSIVALLTLTSAVFGQAISQNGGAIQGTVTDSTGAVVPGAAVMITSPDTGYAHALTTDRSGFYSLGPLTPGRYSITVTTPNFQKYTLNTVVSVGTTTSGSARLSVGRAAETVQVNAGAVQINTDQISLSDVITKEQIDAIPVNGRNFLDLAQIEPGVILQSGESFDPTKAGYSAISVGGVSGRTTRILLDGQDITDETVGTTIFNVSAGSINEFQLNRSTQDVSGEVTSQGQVLVTTTSGTNAYHGELFYLFQDNRELFATVKGINPPFQRNQYGGSIGGPIIKDKLFFFGNSERVLQKTASPAIERSTANGGLFGSILTAYPTIPTPFRDIYSVVRLDYNGPFAGHYFVRANYNVNGGAANAGVGYSLYSNRDNTPGIVGGADFVRGNFTHSFRYGYEKFHNFIADSTSGNSTIYNGIPGFEFYNSAQGLYSGPNYLAPQGTYQSDKQVRYDGSWTKGTHSIKYGYALNRVLGGGFAAFFGLSPRASENSTTAFSGPTMANPNALGCNGVAGAPACLNDPIRGYHIRTLYVGNGQGFFTENPGFGLIGGGVGDWRQSAYVADTWKATPNLTITAGLRWSVDTGRINADLAAPTCGDVAASVAFANCGPNSNPTASLFAQWNPALAGNVHQPYGNFGPQAGLNYSPGDHKTSLRIAAGIFYESDVFNNTTNARSSLIKKGAFFDYKGLCAGGGSYTLNFPDGTSTTTTPNGTNITDACNTQSILTAAPQLIALQQQYQANTKANALSSNGGYVGNTLTVQGAYGSPYRTPYSEQISAGIQRELFRGATLSADFVHNTTLKISQYVDQNHIGAARYLNTPAAQSAIAATTAAAGCAGGSSPTAIDCAITAGATIDDFAGNGLDSGNSYLSGNPASYYGLPTSQGAAFGGSNPLLGNGEFLLPIGKVSYDALQMVFRSQNSHPIPGVVSSQLQMSYTLSRVLTTSGGGSDAFFSSGSYDNDHPNAYLGRNGLDHTNEFVFGGAVGLKYGPQINFKGAVFSAVSQTLTLDNGDATGDIFRTDITGDGTTGDIAPGTLQGYYGHQLTAKDLPRYISTFNATKANTLTPAGQALVTANLFTPTQLLALNGVIQPIATPSPNYAFSFPRSASLDAGVRYPIPVGRLLFHDERFTLEPGITFYNALNIANYGNASASGSLLNTSTTAGVCPATPTVNCQSGYLTGDNSGTLSAGRSTRGSGTFDQNAPRTTEFQLKINF